MTTPVQFEQIAEALAQAQGEMKNATFNRTNPHFRSKYADLASVFDAIRSALSRHGIAVTQPIEWGESGPFLKTILMHKSGQYLCSEFPLPSTAKLQDLGSALTYARRYSLSSLVGISADDDDDANASHDAGQSVGNGHKEPELKPSPIAAQAVQHPGGEPRELDVPVLATGEKDWISWGGSLIAAIKLSKTEKERNQWMDENFNLRMACAPTSPKVSASIDRCYEQFSSEKQVKGDTL